MVLWCFAAAEGGAAGRGATIPFAFLNTGYVGPGTATLLLVHTCIMMCLTYYPALRPPGRLSDARTAADAFSASFSALPSLPAGSGSRAAAGAAGHPGGQCRRPGGWPGLRRNGAAPLPGARTKPFRAATRDPLLGLGGRRNWNGGPRDRVLCPGCRSTTIQVACAVPK